MPGPGRLTGVSLHGVEGGDSRGGGSTGGGQWRPDEAPGRGRGRAGGASGTRRRGLLLATTTSAATVAAGLPWPQAVPFGRRVIFFPPIYSDQASSTTIGAMIVAKRPADDVFQDQAASCILLRSYSLGGSNPSGFSWLPMSFFLSVIRKTGRFHRRGQYLPIAARNEKHAEFPDGFQAPRQRRSSSGSRLPIFLATILREDGIELLGDRRSARPARRESAGSRWAISFCIGRVATRKPLCPPVSNRASMPRLGISAR